MDKGNIKGKVKSVCTWTGENTHKFYFNEEGQIVRRELNYWGNTYIYLNYLYNEDGKLVSFDTYKAESPDKLISTMVYTYNEEGFLESFGTSFSRSVYYEYDRKGNCILETRDHIKIKKIYNNNNQLVEELHFRDWEETRHVWGTDENGEYFENDEMLPSYQGARISYRYNDSGDVSFIKNTYQDKSTMSELTYGYDEKGNWTEKTIVSNGDKTQETRLIEYYEGIQKHKSHSSFSPGGWLLLS